MIYQNILPAREAKSIYYPVIITMLYELAGLKAHSYDARYEHSKE